MASTPNGRNLFWRLFEQGQRDCSGVWSFQSPSADNPFVRKEYLESEREIKSPAAFSIEYEAKFLQPAGAVFSLNSIENCTETGVGPIGQSIVIGIDWAKYGDYTSIAVVSGSSNQCSVHFLDQVHGKEWDAQLNWLLPIIAEYPSARIYCDRTGIGDGPTWNLRERTKQPVVGVQFTAKTKLEMIDRLVGLFETRSISIPPHPLLLEQLHNYYAQPSSSGGVKIEARTGHDDLVSALLLATYHLPMRHHVLEGKPR
jgi:hypothetical protein